MIFIKLIIKIGGSEWIKRHVKTQTAGLTTNDVHKETQHV